MFLRSADGTKYINSDRLTKLQVSGSGPYVIDAYAINSAGSSVAIDLATGLSTDADARALRDRLIAVLLGTSSGDFFFAEYQGEIVVAARSVAELTTSGTPGSWQVGTDVGLTLAVSLADQTAATAAMDAIANAVGAIDVARLIS